MTRKNNLKPSIYAGTQAWIGPEASDNSSGIHGYDPTRHGTFSAELLKGFDAFSFGMVLLAIFYTDGAPPKHSGTWPKKSDDPSSAVEFMDQQSPRYTTLPAHVLREAVRNLLAERVSDRPVVSSKLLHNETEAYRDWEVERVSNQSSTEKLGRQDTTFNQGVIYWSKLDEALLATLDLQYQQWKTTGNAVEFEADVLFGLFIRYANGGEKDFRTKALEYLAAATSSGHSAARAIYAAVMTANAKPLGVSPAELKKWQLDAIEEGFLFPDQDALSRKEIDEARIRFRSSGGYVTDPFLSEAALGARVRDVSELEKWILKMGVAAQKTFIDARGNRMIHVAAALGEVRAVKLLLDVGEESGELENDENETPLYKACQGGHAEAARILLERGHSAKVSSKATRTTCLHWLFNFPESDIPSIGNLLVYRGQANVNATIIPRETIAKFPQPIVCKHYPFSLPYGTPFHYAAFARNWTAMDTLLGLGADINATYSSGGNATTPLAIAVYRNDAPLVQYLLERGADIEITDQKGRNFLHLLTFRTDAVFGTLTRRFHIWVWHSSFVNQVKACTDIAQMLVEHGVCITARAKAYNSPSPTSICIDTVYQDGAVICALLTAGGDANDATRSSQETLLHSWAGRDATRLTFPDCYHYVMAKIVRDTKMLSASCEWDGDTPLHIVANSTASNSQFEGSLEMLLGRKPSELDPRNVRGDSRAGDTPSREWADINAVDKKGFTPLMKALTHRYNPHFRAQLLLRHGAFLDWTAPDGQSALSQVCNSRYLMDAETRDLVKFITSKIEPTRLAKIIAGYPGILGRAAADGKLKTTKLLLEIGLAKYTNYVEPRNFRHTNVRGNALTLTFVNAEIERRAFIQEAASYIRSAKMKKADRKKDDMLFRGTAKLGDILFGGMMDVDDGSRGQVSRARSKEAYLAYPEIMRLLLSHRSKRPHPTNSDGTLWQEGQPTWWDAVNMPTLGFTRETQPYGEHWEILYELERLESSWSKTALETVMDTYKKLTPTVMMLLRWPQLQREGEATNALLTDGRRVLVKFDGGGRVDELRDLENRKLDLGVEDL